MRLRTLLLVIGAVTVVRCQEEPPPPPTTTNPCLSLGTCSACVQHPDCAWCSLSDYHGQNKQQQPRCNTPEGHSSQGRFACPSSHLVRHENEIRLVRDLPLQSTAAAGASSIPMQPQHVSLKLRVGHAEELRMRYHEVADYPLDLYYLMDGTFTMEDDKDKLAEVGDMIGNVLRGLTSKYRLGFGTFVDKTTMPFIEELPQSLGGPIPCNRQNCVKPYGFKNHMRLNSDTSNFSSVVKNVSLTSSSDEPEGGLDALIQVMVCEEQIGWQEQSRRLVILATDATFHYAGDGWLGGVLLPNDGDCHMDGRGEYYTHSLRQDYPSLALVNSKAKENSINLIFAITSDVMRDYQLLQGVIEGSKTAELTRDSGNIVGLIEEEYQRIISRVEIRNTFPAEYFRVSFYSACVDGGVEVQTTVCEGLDKEDVVSFRVEIELLRCPAERSEWRRQYRIYAVGVPDGLDVDVESLCDCPCEEQRNWIRNSSLCNGNGDESCGLCVCDSSHFGKYCECSADDKKKGAGESDCRVGNGSDARVCSGRGSCVCGQCQCDSSRYSGPHCECDNQNCLLTNELLCAGHGTCNCGVCACDAGWGGPDCDCALGRETCLPPGSAPNEPECSGAGNCVCGRCECVGYYSGRYCDKCLHESCPNKCGQLQHCVQCKVHGTGVYNPSDCELNCFTHDIAEVDVVTVQPNSDETLCKVEDPSDSCVVVFSYTENRKQFSIKAQSQKECPPKAPIVLILTIGASIVVVIGVIAFVAYRLLHMIRVKREFARYESERKGVHWGQETNPLYNSPVGTFQNPSYMGGHEKMS